MGAGGSSGSGGYNQVGNGGAGGSGDLSGLKWEGTGPKPSYPGNNPMKPPPGYEWRGSGPSESGKGSYYNGDRTAWRPDLDHPEPIRPHWDYYDGNKWWRVFPDDSYEAH
ncbi:MAG: hypothetical protein LBL34_06500 [Clostridiales bacterium]|jgi:hypothetical protein|nr:hypothetical protein [Clostridiales bacterium]